MRSNGHLGTEVKMRGARLQWGVSLGHLAGLVNEAPDGPG